MCERLHGFVAREAANNLDAHMSNYTLDNSWNKARRRLSLLEEHLDPMTKRRLTMLGIRQGLRCLEVGAGGGSVASWLCEQVGPTGRVVATDIDIQFAIRRQFPKRSLRPRRLSETRAFP